MIPDPMYDDVTGDPLPDTDGSFLRVQSLYRWLTNGIRELTRRTNWTVLDWTAMPGQHGQQVYALDRRFINVDGCFANQYRLMHLDELHTIYPSYAIAQPLWFSWHHRSDKLELSLWPACDRTDPVVNLMTTLGPTEQTIAVNSTAGFLPFGWIKVGSELMQYSELLPALTPTDHPRLAVVRRGVSGTQVALHYAGDTVEHLGLWARGWRAPNPVRQSTDCIELPVSFIAPLESYVMARVRDAEQDRQGAMSHMQEFTSLTTEILQDPTWQQPPFPLQARAYGDSMVGGMAWGRVVVP